MKYFPKNLPSINPTVYPLPYLHYSEVKKMLKKGLIFVALLAILCLVVAGCPTNPY